MQHNLNILPSGLPVPEDDGMAAHLVGTPLPDIALTATDGTQVNLSAPSPIVVIYIYPLTGDPDVPFPASWGWNEIPGARGCTPQACDFSEHYQALVAENAMVFGLSSQTTDYQKALKNRLHLPFELLSYAQFLLKDYLSLPTFTVQDMQLYKRLTLITVNNTIKKVFYPVFPPNENAKQVLEWLKNHASS